MSTKINREAYERLIEEDLKALAALPDGLERSHIEQILHWSIGALYSDKAAEKPSSVLVRAIAPGLAVPNELGGVRVWYRLFAPCGHPFKVYGNEKTMNLEANGVFGHCTDCGAEILYTVEREAAGR